MNRFTKTTLSAGLLLSVAACGSGDGVGKGAGGVPFKVLAPVENGSTNASFVQGNNALTYNGEVVSRATDTKKSNGSLFVHFYDRDVATLPSGSALANGNIQTIRANTGKTHAFVFGNSASGGMFTQYGRSVSTDMPVSGTATYSGHYGGLFQVGGGAGRIADEQILGVADFFIDFSNKTASGTISQRRNAANPNLHFENIQLVGGIVDDNGIISGTAQGGRPTYLATANNLPGRPFSAVIGGTNGDEVAGYARTDWTGNGTKYSETGAFSATQN